MKTLFALSAVVTLFATTAQAKDADWTIDPSHSTIGFKVKHLGVSYVTGKFKEFEGSIKADEKTGKISYTEASTKVASIDTGIAKRDEHLLAPDFFDAKNHPTLTLKTKKISFKGNRFTAVVDLTIRGVTKTVTAEGELVGVHKVNFGDGDQLRAGYTAQAKINRKDFGLSFGAVAEGVSVVGDEVMIQIELEMSRKL